jgi:hypothetical protein
MASLVFRLADQTLSTAGIVPRVHPINDVVQGVVIFCKRKVVAVGVWYPGYIILYFLENVLATNAGEAPIIVAWTETRLSRETRNLK